MAVDAVQDVKCVNLLPSLLPEDAQGAINNSLRMADKCMH
jgi:hypothetical protein